MRRRMLLMLAWTLLLSESSGQVVLRDSTESVELPQVVVTATRSERTLERVPVPMTLITAEQIRERGAVRLSDVLSEEVGLMLVEDHGTGVQLQGFDPAYTLILVDGDPVIGRTNGTLDLDRLSVSDVERVEVVRGPSSSLYGSEALAGVINIITREPVSPLAGSVRTRFETHGTTSLTANAEMRREWVGIRITADRYSSDGYDLSPSTPGATAPQFTDYALSSTADASLAEGVDVQVGFRLTAQDQQNHAVVNGDAGSVRALDLGRRTDWSLSPRIDYQLRPGLHFSGRGYASRYQTRLELSDETTGETLSLSDFDQQYQKVEGQLDALVARRHLVTAGAGFVRESVTADRIRGGGQEMTSGFALLQHEISPYGWMDVITSGRIDLHSAYGTHVSPKIAMLLRPTDHLRFRVSGGSGFKAPTFQQLYLDFSNATSGYSVVGSIDAADVLRSYEQEGQIVRYLTDVHALEEVGPETSIAINAGVEAAPFRWLDVRVNLFHNEVRNLIETAPVAVKSNGQNIFSYFNLNRIYTRGIESELMVRPTQRLRLAAGYQLLEAKDRDVLDAIAGGTLYRRVDGRDRRVTAREYGGLMNRSRHAANLRLEYAASGFSASLRGQYRSRYGFGDRNGNLVLDDAREYVPGHWLVHVTVTQRLPYGISVQTGARNLLDHKNPTLIPSLSGRLLHVGLQLDV